MTSRVRTSATSESALAIGSGGVVVQRGPHLVGRTTGAGRDHLDECHRGRIGTETEPLRQHPPGVEPDGGRRTLRVAATAQQVADGGDELRAGGLDGEAFGHGRTEAS